MRYLARSTACSIIASIIKTIINRFSVVPLVSIKMPHFGFNFKLPNMFIQQLRPNQF